MFWGVLCFSMHRQLFIKIPIWYLTKSREIIIELINRNRLLFIHRRQRNKIDTFERIFRSNLFVSLNSHCKTIYLLVPNNIYLPIMKPFSWTCATITCNHISESGPPIETIRFLVIFAAKINFSGHTFWKNYLMKVLFRLF